MAWITTEGGWGYDDGQPDPNAADPSQRYISVMVPTEDGQGMMSQQINPNYDWQTYAPEEHAANQKWAEQQTGQRGGLFGAFDRVGKVFEDNVTQPLSPYVHSAADRFGSALNKYGVPLAAMAITGGAAAEFMPGLMASMGASNGVTGLGELGINTALPAGAEGGIAAGTSLAGGAAGGSNALASIMGGAGTATGAAGGISNWLGPALGAGAQVAGSVLADRQISQAADTAAASADKNLAFQREMFNTIRSDQQPFLDAGKAALGKLSPLMDYKKFSLDDFKADPGYNFRLTQGQRGIDASAAARGGLQSGAALKAAATFGQEMGSQEYQNAFNRYGVERDRAISPLMQMAGFGQTATNNAQQGTTNFANTSGQIMQNAGDTAANAQVARGSTYSNTGNQLAQMLARYGNRTV